MEVVHCDSGAGKPHPQRFAEGRRRVDRHDLHGEPPVQWAGEQPVPDAVVVTAVNDAQDLAGSRSTIVVIHGSNRVQAFVAGSWK